MTCKQVCITGSHVSTVRGAAYPVENIVRAGVDHLDHDVGVEEVGGDHVRHERSVLILENNGHDVVPYVPLSLQLQGEKTHF